MRNERLKGIVIGSVCAMLVFVAANAVAGTGIGDVFNIGEENNVNATSTLKGTTKGAQLRVLNEDSAQTALDAESLTGTAVYGHSGTGKGVVGESDSSTAGTFTSAKSVGVRATGTTRGIEASNTAGGLPAAWAHHDGATPGFGLLAQSSNGPAAKLVSSTGQPPMIVNSTTRVGSLNADMVDGLHASLQPGPNRLVATGASGELPLSVIPGTTFGKEIYADRCDSAGTCTNNAMPATLSFTVGPGAYLVMGKLTAFANANSAGTVECRASAGADFDISRGTLGFAAGGQYMSTIPTFLLHTFSSGGTVTLTCRDFTNHASQWNMKLLAVKLDGETHTAAG